MMDQITSQTSPHVLKTKTKSKFKVNNQRNECLIMNNGVDYLEFIDNSPVNENLDQANPAAEKPKEGGRKSSFFGKGIVKNGKNGKLAFMKEDPAPAADAAAGGEKKEDFSKPPAVAAFAQPENSYKYFNTEDNKIIIPSYCRRRLNKQKIFGLATNAKNWLDAWRTASGKADAKFDELPLLDAAQLATFYKVELAHYLRLSMKVLLLDLRLFNLEMLKLKRIFCSQLLLITIRL